MEMPDRGKLLRWRPPIGTDPTSTQIEPCYNVCMAHGTKATDNGRILLPSAGWQSHGSLINTLREFGRRHLRAIRAPRIIQVNPKISISTAKQPFYQRENGARLYCIRTSTESLELKRRTHPGHRPCSSSTIQIMPGAAPMISTSDGFLFSLILHILQSTVRIRRAHLRSRNRVPGSRPPAWRQGATRPGLIESTPPAFTLHLTELALVLRLMQ
ncbi:hypothetical protein N656DRAFT_252569 [Canariomyces notabilis]|uniref:Uncharacterized protein n=1 Tax=Canariomyces notabilis TaxID=2074819 RepID=A0AAN6TL68_9PEZI|nr:hypothetical protein N656DRAFT_252569 [Canariomyces arenarius]